VTASFRHTDPQREKLDKVLKQFEKTYDGETPVRFSYESDRNAALWVEKEGYWTSGLRHKFPTEDRVDKDDGSPNGHYRREFTVILRKKEIPRPLYLHKVDWAELPGYDQPYGYDLEAADWVVPHGKGKNADFVFTARAERLNENEFRMDLSLFFSNPSDGLIKVEKSKSSHSQLLLGRMAPAHGYVEEYTDSYGVTKENGELVFLNPDRQDKRDEIEGYWFRVRSKPDPNGNEGIEARYGKILGPIAFSGRPERNPVVSFTYFLAPDHSRSLEFNGENLMRKEGGNLNSIDKH
jgi:hypothetical protein